MLNLKKQTKTQTYLQNIFTLIVITPFVVFYKRKEKKRDEVMHTDKHSYVCM